MLKVIVYVMFSTLSLLIVGCSDSDGYSSSQLGKNNEIMLKTPAKEQKPSNWYIRLVAEDTLRNMKSESTQLGTLDDVNVTRQYALKAFLPFSGSYLDVVFVDPIGLDQGAYKSVFHTYNINLEDRWQFTVRTDDPNAEITLYSRGLYILTPYSDSQNRQRYEEYRSMRNPLLQHMKLVDVASMKVIPAMNGNAVVKYTFNMDGQKERSFEWVIENEEVNITVSSSRRSSGRMLLTEEEKHLLKQKRVIQMAEKFDLQKPPVFEENR